MCSHLSSREKTKRFKCWGWSSNTGSPLEMEIMKPLLPQVVILVCLLSPTVFGAPQRDKLPLLRDASSSGLSENEEYDYIIVGGGTAGCPLAATLSQKFKVLLLERGGAPYGNPNIERIEFFVENLSQFSLTSPAQAFISEDGVMNRRARVLGGGTCLNAGFYTRASRDFIQKAGWDERLVEDSYSWVEKVVAFVPELKQWQSAFRQGLLEVGVLPDNGVTYDHEVGTKTGGSIFDSTGYRHTAADLLRYSSSSNIDVLLHAAAKRIVFSQGPGQRPRASGVIYTDKFGIERQARLKLNPHSEVIVSSGALGSPQLLMLSGIGPQEHLQSMRIPVVLNAPQVGQGMADNPMNAIFVPSPRPLEVSLVEVVGITNFGSFIESASARNLAGFLFPTLGNVPPGMRTQELSDSVQKQLQGISPEELGNFISRTGVLMEKVDGPLSSGHLKLLNTDVNSNPSVRFNYFAEQADLDRCVRGVQLMEKLMASPAMNQFQYLDIRNIPEPFLKIVRLLGNLLPGNTSDILRVELFCKETVLTIWHYHGGCQVGRVVDEAYRVLGVDNLRVVDGSTFLASPGTNPQATVMMLGRYVGVNMLRERIKQEKRMSKRN